MRLRSTKYGIAYRNVNEKHIFKNNVFVDLGSSVAPLQEDSQDSISLQTYQIVITFVTLAREKSAPLRSASERSAPNNQATNWSQLLLDFVLHFIREDPQDDLAVHKIT